MQLLLNSAFPSWKIFNYYNVFSLTSSLTSGWYSLASVIWLTDLSKASREKSGCTHTHTYSHWSHFEKPRFSFASLLADIVHIILWTVCHAPPWPALNWDFTVWELDENPNLVADLFSYLGLNFYTAAVDRSVHLWLFYVSHALINYYVEYMCCRLVFLNLFDSKASRCP